MGVPVLNHSDTDPVVRRLQIERLRAMSPAQRGALMEALNRDCERMAMAGIRSRHPNATDREVLMRLGVLRNGPELMKAAFGWDAAVEGR